MKPIATGKIATGNAVLRAYSRAADILDMDKKNVLLAHESSAGFVIPDGQTKGHRTGIQVFVRVVRFSEELLNRKPITGGLLLANAKR